MQQLGLQSDLTIIPDAPHAFIGRQVWFNQMIQRTDAFFKQTLK
jgi:hypothetical protein